MCFDQICKRDRQAVICKKDLEYPRELGFNMSNILQPSAERGTEKL